MTSRPLGWPSIVRLGMVQSAIGAMVMLSTSLLNRVMVVEYALPAAIWSRGIMRSSCRVRSGDMAPMPASGGRRGSSEEWQRWGQGRFSR